jgi:hypothetical protein
MMRVEIPKGLSVVNRRILSVRQLLKSLDEGFILQYVLLEV